jgi:uncharacterized membrane-anchored protein YitT (DUF2179 family)
LIKSVIGIAIGSLAAAVGLKSFLIPNHLVDGGIVGIAIMSAQIFQLPLGVFLLLLNIPLIYLGYRKLGLRFAVTSLCGIAGLVLLTGVIDWPVITMDPVLAATFGGAAIGLGVGAVIRYGGTLDGAEIVAILIDRRSPFTVGEIIMFMNLFIIGSAGFVFGWDRAMYSLLAYVVAYKVIDLTVEGLNESKAAWIISKRYTVVGRAIYDELGRKVTYINGGTGAGLVSDGVILSVITRLEELRLKSVVKAVDPDAFVVITSAHDVMGKNFKAKPHSE